jgi:hypothetical protein
VLEIFDLLANGQSVVGIRLENKLVQQNAHLGDVGRCLFKQAIKDLVFW